MDFLNDSEHEAVRRVVDAGQQFGYGNMIDRLKIAWALMLHEQWGMSLPDAFRGAGLDPERAERPGTDAAKVQWMKQYIGDAAAKEGE